MPVLLLSCGIASADKAVAVAVLAASQAQRNASNEEEENFLTQTLIHYAYAKTAIREVSPSQGGAPC